MSVPCLVISAIVDSMDPVFISFYSDAVTASVLTRCVPVKESMEERIEITLQLSMMVGLITIALGVFRLAHILTFISVPILVGFSAGSGILTCVNVFKDILGVKVAKSVILQEASCCLI